MNNNGDVVRMLRAGSEKCFDALFRRYYKPLCTYATRFVSAARAEELVQDTLMWIWENRLSLHPQMPLKSLMFTIVRNKSLNSRTRNNIKTRVIDELANKYDPQFDDPDFYLENDLVYRLTEALNKMPEEFRKTFKMHRLDGMTHKEIATKLNVSTQTVNYRIGQTVRMLREELKDYLPLLVLLWPDLF
ncbi:MAG: RNA polymerase sigma-70 factor [Rikenellaceae bacterium]|nr:RNA polymerase sigma-70 factor [Rikenellaceae bacterium]